MFELCEQKCSLPLERERVIKLMMSFNEPMVGAPRHPVQQSRAYICTFKEDEGPSVYIYLYLTTEKVGLLYRYVGEPSSEGSRTVEDDAVQFAEDMGFLIDDLRFDELLMPQQEKLLATIPMFTHITPDIQQEMPAEIVEVVSEEPIEAAEVVVEESKAVEKKPAVPEVQIKAAEVVVEESKAIEKKSAVPEEQIKAAEVVVEESKAVEKKSAVPEEQIKAAEVLVEESKAVEKRPEEEKEMQQKTDEKIWEPERFLSKFRMRAAAERLKKNKA